MQVKVVRLLVGSFFTSLDMQGVSISLLPVDSDRLARLDAPTQASFTSSQSCMPCTPNLTCLTAYSYGSINLCSTALSKGPFTNYTC